MTVAQVSSRTVPDFSGQVAIVTGAAHGIGRSIAEALAAAGARVVVADRDGGLARESAAQLIGSGWAAAGYEVDVTDEGQMGGLVAFADGQPGRLSILVNNAGISTLGLAGEVAVRDWRRVLDVNLTGPFIAAKAVIPLLQRGGGGRIINVASVAAKRISANMSASYTASKAGLVGLTRHLAYETAPWGITVNAICPGPVAAPMMYREVGPEGIATMLAGIPAGRLTTPDDQSDAVLFLASPAAAMITGVALDVDGGALLGWDPVSAYMARHGVELPSSAAALGSDGAQRQV